MAREFLVPLFDDGGSSDSGGAADKGVRRNARAANFVMELDAIVVRVGILAVAPCALVLAFSDFDHPTPVK